MRRLAGLLAILCLGAAPPAPAPAPEPVDLNALMAETPAPTLAGYHLFTDVAGRRPNAGLTPYSLNTRCSAIMRRRSGSPSCPRAPGRAMPEPGCWTFRWARPW